MNHRPFRIGFMINPIAGMGGAVGLHGTDAGIHLEATRLGASPISTDRAKMTLIFLFNSQPWLQASSEIVFFTPQGQMGGDLLRSMIDQPQIKLIPLQNVSTTAGDTQEIAKSFLEQGVDLILFAGGDGTARDIFEVIQDSIPLLGIPAGVKMRSGVFGLHPAKVGEVLERIIATSSRIKSALPTQDAEILDLGENSSDYSSSEFFGVAKTPYAPDLIQRSKSASGDSGASALDELALQYAKAMKPKKLYLFGPGGSTNRILKSLGLSLSPKGVHAILDGQCIGEDVGEAEIGQIVARNSECELIVGVIGGQGYLFGRGNQQLSAAVIEAIGWSRIFILASAEKLLELMPTELLLDFHQPLRNPPPSFVQVHTSSSRTIVCRLIYQVPSPSTSTLSRSYLARVEDAGSLEIRKDGFMSAKDETLPQPHPFMANSAPASYRELLRVAEVKEIDEVFEQIPNDHLFKGKWKVPRGIKSEAQLSKHLTNILRKNISVEDYISFLGAGCWNHYVPAICDEMVTRTEFSTPVWGTTSSDHGRNQVWFEFCSQLGELVGMEFVGLPLYSYGTAAGHALRMAARINGRKKILVPASLDPERAKVIRTYAGFKELNGFLDVIEVKFDTKTGRLDLADLKAKLDKEICAVYFENPNYLGALESEAAKISKLAHSVGAEVVVGVDPISLGIIAPPSQYGADIIVGTTQPLGVHMNAGGGVGGFIATRDEEKYAKEYPTLQVSLTGTTVPGEMAFGLTLFHQSSYGSRENGKDWTGNSVYLWAVANATYMSLMGPEGFVDVGNSIVSRARYAAERINKIKGVKVLWRNGFFKEFVVNFDMSGKSVKKINNKLLKHEIFGGKDLSNEFPELGDSALYCVTEVHTLEDIDALVDALKEVTA